MIVANYVKNSNSSSNLLSPNTSNVNKNTQWLFEQLDNKAASFSLRADLINNNNENNSEDKNKFKYGNTFPGRSLFLLDRFIF